ncbi:MAG: hypothetical protein EGQ32_00070 [Prevotella sp.]|nr:hypothetical protein [Prevotella sp.]
MLATIDTPISITNIKNMNTREQNWLNGYEALKHYIEEHKQLPDKKKVEHRSLLNWWKYNRKLIRQGKLDEMRTELLMELGNSRINHR